LCHWDQGTANIWDGFNGLRWVKLIGQALGTVTAIGVLDHFEYKVAHAHHIGENKPAPAQSFWPLSFLANAGACS